MTILYRVHHGLYVNLTNRCSCACTFCVRGLSDSVGEAESLWLSREPTYEEVIAAFGGESAPFSLTGPMPPPGGFSLPFSPRIALG